MADTPGTPRTVEMPASTPAPLLSAAGLALLFAGLVTNAAASVVGAVLLLAGVVAWFRCVLPQEQEESVPIEPVAPIVPAARAVLRLEVGEAGHRARLPVMVYPYTAGIAGGIAGGIAMALLALLYGLVAHGSVWYPVNLLAAAGSAAMSAAPDAALLEFHADAVVLALVIHGALSVLVGLLYGALLPMLPAHPAFWGGIAAPLMWTALIAASLEAINPVLNARIDWAWFIVTQVAFGLVAGFVVARRGRIPTSQHLPFAVRAGLEGQDGPE
jgi:hypothetical protein